MYKYGLLHNNLLYGTLERMGVLVLVTFKPFNKNNM